MHQLDLAPFWLRLICGFVSAAVTWIIAADIGSSVVEHFVHFTHPAARLGVAAALGYALVGSSIALLGIVHATTPAVIIASLVIMLTVRLPILLKRLRSLPAACAQALDSFRRSDVAIRCALFVKVSAEATGVIIATLPAVWWDPIAYHLPIVAAVLRHGGFIFDPQMVQSGFPLLGEASATPAYALAGSAGAAMVTLGTGVCVALLAWALADGLAAGTGPIAGMLAVSSGLWLWLAPSFYVDMPFAMFVLAGIVVALQLSDDESLAAVAGLAGAFCGAAAATKYSGLALAVIIVALVLFRARRLWTRALFGFLAGFVLLAAGWYVRTLVATGDPVYPFGWQFFARSTLTSEFGQRYVDMTRHWCGGGSSFTDFVTLPYRLLVEPHQFCGDPGLALRTAVILAILALAVNARARGLAGICLIMMVVWFATSQQWRFALPAVLLCCAVAAAGVAAAHRLRRATAIALSALAAYVVLTNWLPSLRSQASSTIVPAYSYIVGKQSAEQYLDTRLETFAAARWLRDHGVSGDHVLALDDVRDYYFPQGTIWANPYYQEVLAPNWSTSFDARYGTLAARGFRYIVVNANDAYLRRTPTGIDWSVFESDRHHLVQLFSANGVAVYRLPGEP